jgi:hypothetical protein
MGCLRRFAIGKGTCSWDPRFWIHYATASPLTAPASDNLGEQVGVPAAHCPRMQPQGFEERAWKPRRIFQKPEFQVLKTKNRRHRPVAVHLLAN